MTKTVDGSNLGYLIGKIRAAFWAKGDTSELTIDATPTSASDNLVKSGGVYDFVGDLVENVTAPTPYDGTFTCTTKSGDTITVDLNHTHPQYPRYVLCADEAEYNAIVDKQSDTLYLIPES